MAVGRFSAFESRNFRLYFLGQVASWSGRLMQDVAMAWLVLDLTGSPLALGVFTALRHLPVLGLGLTAGVFVDRLPKRALVTAINVGGTMHAGVMAALTLSGTMELGHLYALGLALGALNAFDNTSRDAFVLHLVDRSRLHNAVSLNSSSSNLARIVGPALGGVIVAAGGTGWCFLINAACHATAALTLMLIRVSEMQPDSPAAVGNVRSQLADGLRYARDEPGLRVPLVLQLFIGLFGYNFATYVPLLARFAFDAGPVGLGALGAARGAGAVIGAFVVAGTSVLSGARLAQAGALFGILLALTALAPQLWLALIVIALLGAAEVYYRSSVQTTLLLGSAEGYRGRVMSVSSLLTAGSSPIGSTITGSMADVWGIRVAVTFLGTMCVVGGVVGGLIARRSPFPGSGSPPGRAAS